MNDKKRLKQIAHLEEETKRLNLLLQNNTTKKENGKTEINIPKILDQIFENNKKLQGLRQG